MEAVDPTFSVERMGDRDLAILSWCHTTQLMLDFFTAWPHRCYISLYEGLVANPAEAVRELLEFLGLDNVPSAAEGICQRRYGHAPPRVRESLRAYAEELYMTMLRAKFGDDELVRHIARYVSTVYAPPDDDVVVISRKRLEALRNQLNRATGRDRAISDEGTRPRGR